MASVQTHANIPGASRTSLEVGSARLIPVAALGLSLSVFFGGGFLLISAGWKALFEAQRHRALATTGLYAHVRHPQYVGFILVMFGFLLQWPTLLTLAMLPVLVFMYVRLARTEDREAVAEFGATYRAHMAEVPGFVPRLRPGVKVHA